MSAAFEHPSGDTSIRADFERNVANVQILALQGLSSDGRPNRIVGALLRLVWRHQIAVHADWLLLEQYEVELHATGQLGGPHERIRLPGGVGGAAEIRNGGAAGSSAVGNFQTRSDAQLLQQRHSTTLHF